MWTARIISLVLLLSSTLALGCHPPLSFSQASPLPVPTQPISPSSYTISAASMNQPLTHAAVHLVLPYYPWQKAYDRVRTDPDLSPYLDRQMIPALEATGDPIQRLTNMANAAKAARIKLAEAGRQTDFSFEGLDLVEIDLRVAFFVALSQHIAESAQSSKAEKIAALNALVEIVHKPYPVGIPEPSEHMNWTATAQISAETAIQVHLEELEE